MSSFSEILKFLFSDRETNSPRSDLNNTNKKAFIKKLSSTSNNRTPEAKIVHTIKLKKDKPHTPINKNRLLIPNFLFDKELNQVASRSNRTVPLKQHLSSNFINFQQELSANNQLSIDTNNFKEILKSNTKVEIKEMCLLKRKREKLSEDNYEKSRVTKDPMTWSLVEEYSKDLMAEGSCQGYAFMKHHFPNDYNSKDPVKKVQLLKSKSRKLLKEMAVPQSSLNNILFLSRERNYPSERNFTKLWSPNHNDSASNEKEKEFLLKVQSIWSYDISQYSVELALEYFMKSNYSFVDDKEKLRNFLLTKRRNHNPVKQEQNKFQDKIHIESYTRTINESKAVSISNRNYHLRRKIKTIM